MPKVKRAFNAKVYKADDTIKDMAAGLNLFDLNRYFNNAIVQGERKPIIGNDEARLTAVLSFCVADNSVVVRGEAGSGKSQILNAIISLMWGDEAYSDEEPSMMFIGAASDKGYLTTEKANKSKNYACHCAIPELQNALNLEDMIKLWCERKPYIYDRYGANHNEKLVLHPVPILTNIADENKKCKDLNEEIERRFVQVYTMSNKAQNERIQQYKARSRFMKPTQLYQMDKIHFSAIAYQLAKAHQIINGDSGYRVVNPFADSVRKLLPSNFTVSNTLIDYFFDLVEAITAFFWQYRTKDMKEKTIFSSLYDNWAAWQIAGKTLSDQALQTPGIGDEILDMLPFMPEFDEENANFTGERGISPDEISERLEEKGVNIKQTQLLEILYNMRRGFFVNTHHVGKKPYFYRKRKKPTTGDIDWITVLEDGIAAVADVYPEMSEQFNSNARRVKYEVAGGGAELDVWIHPTTGEVIDVLGNNAEGELADRIEKQAAKLCAEELDAGETYIDASNMAAEVITESFYDLCKKAGLTDEQVKQAIKKGCESVKK